MQAGVADEQFRQLADSEKQTTETHQIRAKKENMAGTFRILAYPACFVGQTFCCNFSDF
jgi:hypothetical protein